METKKKSSWHGPKQIGIMFYTAILMLIGSCLVGGTTNTILPVVSAKYGWDVSFLRTMAGVGAICVPFGNLLFGTIVKKKGPRFVNTLSLFITVALAVVYGLTSNMTVFIICILLIGFMSGGYYLSGVNSLTANWWPKKKGVVLGWTTMGIVLMDLVWQPFIPRAFNVFGISWTYIGVAAIVLIVGLLGAIFTRNTPEECGEYPDGDPEHASNIRVDTKAMLEYKSPWTFKEMFKLKSAWAISLGFGFMYMASLSVVASIIPRLLSCGYDYNWAIMLLIIGGVCGVVGSFSLGALDQKIGTKKAGQYYICLLFVGVIMVLLHPIAPVFAVLSVIIFFGANGALGNLIPSFVGTKFGRWDYPSAYRVIGSICQLFAGIGIMLTGLFHNFQILYIFDACVIVVAFFIITFTNDKFIGKAG